MLLAAAAAATVEAAPAVEAASGREFVQNPRVGGTRWR
jgi:hypothetical protein